MKIRDIASNWDELGASDPYWAVHTDPQFIHNKWEKEKFYRVGEKQFAKILQAFDDQVTLPVSKALDFGCGPGRMSFQIAKYADKVLGIDVSDSMIALAKQNNPYLEKCEFVVNKVDHLEIISSNSIDLVFSFITLQHNPPLLIKKYLNEFMRVAKPKGQILFNLVSKPPLLYRCLYYALGQKILNRLRRYWYKKEAAMEMHWLDEKVVRQLFQNQGFQLVQKVKEDSVGKNWESYFYLFEKE